MAGSDIFLVTGPVPGYRSLDVSRESSDFNRYQQEKSTTLIRAPIEPLLLNKQSLHMVKAAGLDIFSAPVTV